MAADGAVLAIIGLAKWLEWPGLAVTGGAYESWAWGAAVLLGQVVIGTLLPTTLLFNWERGFRADYVDAVTAAQARGRARTCG
jgi:hypothetical protein